MFFNRMGERSDLRRNERKNNRKKFIKALESVPMNPEDRTLLLKLYSEHIK